jgi:alkylated DNA repair dioxygenase AlkB
MAERRSSVRTATRKSLGGPDVDYNVPSTFTNIFQSTARRRSSAKDAAQTTPSASRKRSGGAGALVTKSESDPGEPIEGLPGFDTLPSATQENELKESDEAEDSDLSELGTTPDCPTPANRQSQDAPDLTAQLNAVAEQLSESASSFYRNPASSSSTYAAPDNLSPESADNVATAASTASPTIPQDISQASDHTELAHTPNDISPEAATIDLDAGPTTEPLPSQSATTQPAPKRKQTLKPKVSPRPPKVAAAQSSAAPVTPSSLRQSGRSKTQPSRLGDLVPTSSAVTGEQIALQEQDESVYDGDSPTVQKVSRKKITGETGNKPGRRKPQPSVPDKKPVGDDAASKAVRGKKPVSQAELSLEDLADDVPDVPDDPAKVTTSRKRKAETSTTTPRKRATKATNTADEPFEVKPKVRKSPVRKTPVARKKKERTPTHQKAALQLPSPPMSISDYLDASGVDIDPDLLKLSRRLTFREPLEKKPAPRGKPEVWAPGRQELCETLPYYKSAHSGCYSNGNTIYSFMFDSAGVGREYMDSDVIIARMGGYMESDVKTGVVSQKDDHDMDAKQPQSVLNNMAHKNPIVIICGDKNAGAITTMPHRYCVLGWFKPTHVWAEKTSTKKKTVTTIRYRFERLDTSKPSWYHPIPAESVEPEPPADAVALRVETCKQCSKSCPQVYLIDWVCTNPKCAAFWQMSNGESAPYDDLDYHPGFLLQRTAWEREVPPFDLNPGVPRIGQHFGDNLSLVNTKGIVCPGCGRCNSRYMFTHWRCDTPGCRWKLHPKHEIVMPSNLSHTPWDMASDGPSLIKSTTAPAVSIQVKYHSNYKVLKYTIEGIAGAVIVAKANKHVVSEPGGADDMFREMQTVDVGLERRMMRKTAPQQSDAPVGSTKASNEAIQAEDEVEERPKADDEDDDDDDEHNAEAGTRMNAFGMNFGMPYKFIASGDSRSFEEAPVAVRTARSLLNWAQRVFVNDEEGYQDFNEELIFGYMDGQKIKYHDDGEMGLGPRIATLSLGGGATMLLRIKAKYFGHVSNTGCFTYEEPLPLPALNSSGYTSGFRGKKTLKPCKDTHEGRHAAWQELKQLKEAGDGAGFRKRSKELSKELELKRTAGEPILTFHLTHGDIVIMVGEDIQKFLEHQVEPTGSLRFALTCRTVLGNHLPPDQLPKYEVADAELYDGSVIREDGDREAVVWD